MFISPTLGFGTGAITTGGFGALGGGGPGPGPIFVIPEFNRLRSLLKNRSSGRTSITGYYEDWRHKRLVEELSVTEEKLNLNSLDAAMAINTFKVINSDSVIIKPKERQIEKFKKERVIQAKGVVRKYKREQIVQGSAKIHLKNINIITGSSIITSFCRSNIVTGNSIVTPLSKSVTVFGEAKLGPQTTVVVKGKSKVTSLIKTRIVAGKSTVKPVKTTKKRKKRRRKIAKTNE